MNVGAGSLGHGFIFQSEREYAIYKHSPNAKERYQYSRCYEDKTSLQIDRIIFKGYYQVKNGILWKI